MGMVRMWMVVNVWIIRLHIPPVRMVIIGNIGNVFIMVVIYWLMKLVLYRGMIRRRKGVDILVGVDVHIHLRGGFGGRDASN